MGGCVAGMCGAELFPVGRGEGENPRGGAGRGKRTHKSTYPKNRQKCWCSVINRTWQRSVAMAASSTEKGAGLPSTVQKCEF